MTEGMIKERRGRDKRTEKMDDCEEEGRTRK